MKYMVSLNGKQYEVIVERGTVTGTPVGAAPASAPKAAPAPTPAAAPAPAPAGGETVAAPMPGTILDIRCTAGQQVNAGDVLFILEAMKMVNEICAPRAGTIDSICVQKGASVATGAPLCTM
ncbi:biotin/lipoyl-containing protein [Agathobaculum sp.]|uniref:biotin/lipoyl-containing protein n=1 Tax=Agathobaculum sp. TaxID=2048138 RepID=UPI003AB6B68E